jgi:hypothetical protein
VCFVLSAGSREAKGKRMNCASREITKIRAVRWFEESFGFWRAGKVNLEYDNN